MAASLKLSTKTSPSQLIALVGALLILAGLYGSYGWMTPKLQKSKAELATAQAQAEGLQSDIDNLLKAQQQLQTAKSNLAASGIDITRANQVIPPTESLPTLYIQMEDLMRRGDDIVSAPGYALGSPAANPDGTVKIPVTVSGTGSYASVKKYLALLQSNIRPLVFTSVSLAPSSSKDAAAGTFTLSAIGYVSAQALSPAYSAK